MSSDRRGPSRREVLGVAAASAVMAAGGLAGLHELRLARQPRQRVAQYRVSSYQADLVELLVRGLREFPAALSRARGGRVVLKPNLVEFDPARPINTHPRFVASVVEAFREVGAAEVVVAEGPGHRRDTHLLLEMSGLRTALEEVGHTPFVDLNIDETHPVPLVGDRTGLGSLHLPRTVLGADLLVSLPKLKTHHWMGATLAMKNLFGVVPGSVYGWPKNPLHAAGIPQAILDLWDTLRPGFAIVDGIVGMEGDGPILGSAREAGFILMGEHLPAVDATAARRMGFVAERLLHLYDQDGPGFTTAKRRIEIVGDDDLPDLDFAVLPRFGFLKGRGW